MSSTLSDAGERRILRPSEVARLMRAVLEDEIGEVWVEGEISNMSRPASGHWYFTLKDSRAELRAVMFKGDRRSAKVEIKDGMSARAFGLITVYEPRGQCQMRVRLLEPLGAGALQAAFEALKRKLAAEGLFDPARKKPLPPLPQRIALVTSASGAAVRDILNVLGRRFNNLRITLAPVRVQGEGAAGEIAAAIDLLNEMGGFDVMIVGRGGGSIEDLWAFNEECVARAIARSRIPVVSAVGHEIDFTICDFAADLRAPTPSAAAELVVRPKQDFENELNDLRARMVRALRHRSVEARHRLAAAAKSSVFSEPQRLIGRYRETLDATRGRLRRELELGLRQTQQRLDELGPRMVRGAHERIRAAADALAAQKARLRILNPLDALRRGYSLTFGPDGGIVRKAASLKKGEKISTRLANGELDSIVEGVRDGRIK